MKAFLLFALFSSSVFAVEVSPVELRQMLLTTQNLQAQLDGLRFQIQDILNRTPIPDEVFSGSCNTDRFRSIGGEDCSDLEAVLRRPRISVEMKNDIEGAISCARGIALKNCEQRYGRGACEFIPGIKGEGVRNQYSGDVNYKCKVTIESHPRQV